MKILSKNFLKIKFILPWHKSKGFYNALGRLILAVQAIFIGTFVVAQQMDADLFPRPAELEPAINFWVRVYTEIDTDSGFLHDSEDLSIIYAQLNRDNQSIESRRQEIKDNLAVLALGKRNDLTLDQEEILKLWPDDVSNQRLKDAIDNVRFQLGQSNAFLGGLERSGAYRDYIAKILRDKNLPQELALLPHVESSFNPDAYSSANAAGMWQFTRPTGQRFMRIDEIIDERLDPYISANAAMDLLEYNHQVLGSWPLALTAYNQGVGGMSRAVRETGTTAIEEIIANYKGNRFRFVGRNFYAQFLAVNEVERDVDLYFKDVQFATAPKYTEVRLDAFISAQTLAESIGTTLEQLQTDNPSLRNIVWQGVKRIPRGFKLKVRTEMLAKEGNLLAGINNGDKYSDQLPDILYEVKRGDSLQSIAERFNTTTVFITDLNQIQDRDNIQIGQRLFLPMNSTTEVNLSNQEEQIRIAEVVPPISQPNELADFPRESTTPPIQDQSDLGISLVNSTPNTPASSAVIANRGQTLTDPIFESLSNNESSSLPTSPLLSDQFSSPAIPYSNFGGILDADPSDYSVALNSTIEVHASETLGHLADWLDVSARDIRELNNMNFRDQIIIGRTVQLDFSRVTKENFELARRNFHSDLQRDFFSAYRIRGAEEYEIRRFDNINRLALNRYSAPLWLVRQYNPGIDFDSIYVGQRVTFPLLEAAGSNVLN